MKIQLLSTLKKYKKDYLKQDIFSGIIIAAVSIPISMGYAQIAGLPPAYGLYGSILPILLFAIFSTSKQFIFGVDAAPAALAGSALTEQFPFPLWAITTSRYSPSSRLTNGIIPQRILAPVCSLI